MLADRKRGADASVFTKQNVAFLPDRIMRNNHVVFCVHPRNINSFTKISIWNMERIFAIRFNANIQFSVAAWCSKFKQSAVQIQRKCVICACKHIIIKR